MHVEKFAWDSLRRYPRNAPWTDEELLPYLTVDSYPSYIQWRTEWKALYRRVSQLIRHTRRGPTDGPPPDPIYFESGIGTRRELMGYQLSEFATALLALRALGKRVSRARRAARLALLEQKEG
jgi:hypothetical protein